MAKMKKEEVNRLVIGDVIQVNAKYRDIFDVDGRPTDFFIEEKDILFIRNVFDGGFVVELREDMLNREEGREFAYGLFKIQHEMIAPYQPYLAIFAEKKR